MTGIKMTRIRKCLRCEHRSTRHSSIDKWPRCKANSNAYLDNDFMEGPDGNCPIGVWDGLPPVDLDAESEANRAKSIAKETAAMKAVVDILSPDEKSAIEIHSKIDQLVTAKIIRHLETALALEDYVDESRKEKIDADH